MVRYIAVLAIPYEGHWPIDSMGSGADKPIPSFDTPEQAREWAKTKVRHTNEIDITTWTVST